MGLPRRGRGRKRGALRDDDVDLEGAESFYARQRLLAASSAPVCTTHRVTMFPESARTAAALHAAWLDDALHAEEGGPVPGTLWHDMAEYASRLLLRE